MSRGKKFFKIFQGWLFPVVAIEKDKIVVWGLVFVVCCLLFVVFGKGFLRYSGVKVIIYQPDIFQVIFFEL